MIVLSCCHISRKCTKFDPSARFNFTWLKTLRIVQRWEFGQILPYLNQILQIKVAVLSCCHISRKCTKFEPSARFNFTWLKTLRIVQRWKFGQILPYLNKILQIKVIVLSCCHISRKCTKFEPSARFNFTWLKTLRIVQRWEFGQILPYLNQILQIKVTVLSCCHKNRKCTKFETCAISNFTRLKTLKRLSLQL